MNIQIESLGPDGSNNLQPLALCNELRNKLDTGHHTQKIQCNEKNGGGTLKMEVYVEY